MRSKIILHGRRFSRCDAGRYRDPCRVSGPGVVKRALEDVKGAPFEVVAKTIKNTAFMITRLGQLVAEAATERLHAPFGIIDLSLAPTSLSVTVSQQSLKKWP